MGELPPFNEQGVLPPGDYELSLNALEGSYLVTGGWREEWDAPWRRQLVRNLRTLVGQLRSVGITEIYADGSFVEDKPHPSDIDGYFVVADSDLYLSGELERLLNERDPFRAWTWDPDSRRYDPSTGKRQLPMWHEYHVELYPHWAGAACGIRDRHGNELEFPAAFRLSRRNWEPRGIIRIGGADDSD